MMGVYLITNLINQKVYIGQAKDIEQRWYQHKERAIKSPDQPIHIAMVKYGIENFKLEILQECSLELLDVLEQTFIRVYCSWNSKYGYNRTFGGQYRAYGAKRSEEAKRKISTAKSKQLYWNNGIKNKMSKECPGEGWVRGQLISENAMKLRSNRLKKIRQSMPEISSKAGSKTKGLRWFNNGDKELRAKIRPDGFQPGRLNNINMTRKGFKMYFNPLNREEHERFLPGQQPIGWLLGYGIDYKPR